MTPSRASELFSYCPETGNLLRRVAAGRFGRFPAGAVVGCQCTSGYLQVRVDGRLEMVHRIVWMLVTGEQPKNVIDHIDGSKTNNRFENLRDVSLCENMQNQRKPHRQNSTKLLGVSVNGSGFSAKIHIGGKQKYLGYFDDAVSAHNAYVTAKRQMHAGNTL